MRFSSSVLAAASLLSTANAAIKGFNYGANFGNDQAKKQVDFEYEFNAAKQLPGTDGWTSARLYTMIQHGTQNSVIEAIPAAIATQTTLLLGLWASAGQGNVDNEITALKAAIAQYGTAFTDLVVGISVGSEDLYRITPTGIENKSGAGAQPSELVNYIQQTRNAIAGTSLSKAPVGHVDTWTAYVNATNNPVIAAVDFIGVDAYPYFQTTQANGIANGGQLFFDAYRATVAAAQGKAVWVTETGWPVTGATSNQAEANTANARTYWQDVTCELVRDNVNLYYYILQDVQYSSPAPSFGIKPGGDLFQVQPLFDLSCPATSVSYSLLLFLSLCLAPLSLTFIYNLSLAISFLRWVSPVHWFRCDCQPSPCLPQNHITRAVWPSSWVAWANGLEKTSRGPLPSSTRSVSQSSVLSGTTHLNLSTSKPIPTVTSKPFSKPSPSRSRLPFENLPVPPSIPTGLLGPFEAPSLILTVDKTDPTKVIGNGYMAQLSPLLSALFVYDIRQEHAGKACTLSFYVPPTLEVSDLSPAKLRSPGGIAVSRLDMPAQGLGAGPFGASVPVGSVASITYGSQYNIASMPCDAGQRVAYQVDSTRGLNMDFFQMSSPALGMFVTVS